MATRPEPKPSVTKKAAPATKRVPAARKAPAKKAAAQTVSRAASKAAAKPAAKTPIKPAAQPVADKSGPAAGLLRAGLKALGTVRDDVAKRQANIVEGLLGIGHAKPGFAGLDGFGIRKFEDVFDQRVATALQRLGLPGAGELQALRDEVAHLRERVATLERERVATLERERVATLEKSTGAKR